MKQSLSRFSSHAYTRLAKPLLFRVPPDKVHNQMLALGKVVQRTALFRAAMSRSFAYYNDKKLQQTLHGVEFRTPIGLSAGFDKNIELLPTLKAVGFGFMEGGTITNQPTPGNPRPWFHRLPHTKALVVHAGIPNRGVDEIINRLQQLSPRLRKDFPLNISVAPSNIASITSTKAMITDCVAALTKIKESGVANVITINLSCPNTTGGEPFTADATALDAYLTAIDAVGMDTPVFLKLPNQKTWGEYQTLLDVIVRHQVAGVTVANLVKKRDQVTLHDPLDDTIAGGISGRPTFAPSNELLKKTYEQYGDRLTISGVGGVFSASDAYTKIRLGASLVQLITGMIFEGPALIGQINKGLVELLERDGYTHLSQAIGVDTSPRWKK